MPRKPKKPEAATVNVSAKITPALERAARKLAKDRGLTLSDAMRIALATWCGDPALAETPSRGRPRLDDCAEK